MKSLKALERKIAADRAAIDLNYRRLRQAVNHRVGSPTGLVSGFAAGFAGGWLVVSRSKRRRERTETRPEPVAGAQAAAKPEKGKLASLYTLAMVTMPVWQKLLKPSHSAPAPPESGESA